jgi:hypothetical protein
VFIFFFSVLALLALDGFLDNFDIPFLPALGAIALTSLQKVRFKYGAFFSLRSFSLANFF